MAENKIGMSGADYIIPPTTDHPFWSDEDIAENLTATATVDNSTGTPSVDVTKNGYNLNFDFKNLKGEKGDKGDTGAKGTPGPDGKNGTSVIVSKVETSESGAVVGRITGLKSQELDPTISSNYETIEVRNGEKGEKGDTGARGPQGLQGEKGDTGATGPQGPQGEVGPQGPQGIQGPAGKDGSDADVSKCVTNVSLQNDSGSSGRIYTIRQKKGDGTTTDVGNIIVKSSVDLFTTQWMYPQPELSGKYNFPSTAPANGKYFLMQLTFRVEKSTDPTNFFDDFTHTIVAKADSSYTKGFEIITGEKINFLIGRQSKTIIENTDIYIDGNPFTGNASGRMSVDYISDDGTERKIEYVQLWYKGVIS